MSFFKKIKLFSLQKLLVFVEPKKDFLTYHLRPKYSNDFGLWSDSTENEPKTAIIIQGPIIKDFSFTLETVKIYKKIFKDQIIILSTWEGEDEKEILKIKQENIKIILNKKPDFYGQQNINLQIVSSRAGALKAKEMGAMYAIKTRTDQRMYAPNSLEFLRNILEVFPLSQKQSIQKKRIIGISLNTFKYRPYGVSDMTIYGQIDDFLLYWSPALDMRKFSNDVLIRTMGDFSNSRICEAYLMTEFLKNIGQTLNITISDYWESLAKHFCVIDQISLDLYWYKYTRHVEHKTLEYNDILSSRSMSFSEWLNLYTNVKSKLFLAHEEMMQRQFGSVIDNK